MSTPRQEPISFDQLLTATEIAAVLRVERSTATIYMRRGIVPARKIGRRWLSPQPLLDQFLASLFEARDCDCLRFSREGLLTPSGVAAVLGVKRSTAMNYMRREVVPAQKIGRNWYSPRPLLDEYLAGLFNLDLRA